MPRFSTLFSIAVHAIVIGAAVIWSTIATGVLPSPRDVFAYHDVSMIAVPDVPPPPSPARPAPDQTVSVNAAPLVEPQQVVPETGLEGVATRSSAPGDVSIAPGVSGGLPGVVSNLEPPPPPAPPPPAKPVHLHSGMTAPRKIVDVQPVYPQLAQAARRGGIVILEAILDVKGNVESVRVLKGVPLLDEAALTAVRQWRFTPALLNGQPVPVVMTVTVNFELR